MHDNASFFFALMNSCCLFGVYHFARFDIFFPISPGIFFAAGKGAISGAAVSPPFFWGNDQWLRKWTTKFSPNHPLPSLKFYQAKSFCLEPVVCLEPDVSDFFLLHQ